ncbi:MAG TPA: hypothetical protein VIR81_09340 [Myxococcales bacterium]
MPSPAEILAGAAQAARESIALAAAWHLAVLAAAIGLAFGLRPSRRRAALAVAILVFSPAWIAWRFGNPFNSTVLAAVSGALFVVGMRLGEDRAQSGPPWSRIAGILLLALGWFYPHFLEHPALYAVAAPLGVLPCPTLCAAAGLTLLANGFSSRAWTLTVAAVAAFYGAFGALRLGVYLDLGLLAGAAALVALAFRDLSTAPGPRRPPPDPGAGAPAPGSPLRGDAR